MFLGFIDFDNYLTTKVKPGFAITYTVLKLYDVSGISRKRNVSILFWGLKTIIQLITFGFRVSSFKIFSILFRFCVSCLKRFSILTGFVSKNVLKTFWKLSVQRFRVQKRPQICSCTWLSPKCFQKHFYPQQLLHRRDWFKN